MRLDLYLFNNGLTDSRTHAQNLIKINSVVVNGKVCNKASLDVVEGDIVEIVSDYGSSLGSLKLEKAFEDFGCNVDGKVCLDIGASNGGFTSVLLKNGAKNVYALDVGECALPKELVEDSRVIVKDNCNARYIDRNTFDLDIDFVVIDVSFISLRLILPVVAGILDEGKEVVALVKPQFELDKRSLTKSGIVKSVKLQEKALGDIVGFAGEIGFSVLGKSEAPHPFKDKNQEYLVYLKKI